MDAEPCGSYRRSIFQLIITFEIRVNYIDIFFKIYTHTQK